jgi:lipopolysaccharide heptosyltransferase II
VRILILKPSSLGDIVQALPVLRSIKLHLPRSEVYWWIASQLMPLLADDPDLAGIVPFERRRWAEPSQWAGICRSVLWMRQQAFDWVIDLQGLARSGIFAWLANGELTVGLDEAREGARGFYDLAVPRPPGRPHAVDRYLAVLPALGVPPARDFQWLPERPRLAAAIRQKWAIGQAPCVSLQPGARWPTKRWPVESYAELVRQMAARFPEARFAVLGSSADQELGRTIARAEPERCLDLTGKLSLPEMVEWLRLSALLITNDTGPMHVAAALGTPVVALFGPTQPRRTGPYGQAGHVLQLDLPCVPCLKSRCAYAKPFECLRAISPATVLAAVEKRLGLPAPPSPETEGAP